MAGKLNLGSQGINCARNINKIADGLELERQYLWINPIIYPGIYVNPQ